MAASAVTVPGQVGGRHFLKRAFAFVQEQFTGAELGQKNVQQFIAVEVRNGRPQALVG